MSDELCGICQLRPGIFNCWCPCGRLHFQCVGCIPKHAIKKNEIPTNISEKTIQHFLLHKPNPNLRVIKN